MNLLVLLLIVPLAAIATILLTKVPAKTVALWAAWTNLGLVLVLFGNYDSAIGGYQSVIDRPWATLPGVPDIHFHLGVDGISLCLLLLTAVVTVAAIAVSPENCKRPREFFAYLLLMSLGAIGAFSSIDLFFFYIFHEFALIPTFLLIGIWGGQNRQFAAMQITLYLTLGSLILLAGILGIAFAFSPAGAPATFDLIKLQDYAHATQKGELNIFPYLYPVLLIGFGILISLFPFHSWAPLGYAEAPPGAAMMHAGVLKKFGVYGLLKIVMPLLPVQVGQFSNLLIFLLLGNVLYIGFVAMAQKEVQSMLGFSSVMHMGYLFLGLLAYNSIGWSGVVLLMVAHGLSAALLFGLAGEIQQRTGENRFAELGGLATKAPALAALFLIGSLASIGLPGLGNFTGEILIFFGSFGSLAQVDPNTAWISLKIVTCIVVWGVVISAVYSLRAVARIFYGPLPERYAGVVDIQGRELIPYILLTGCLLLIGFAPNVLLHIITPGIDQLLAIAR